MKSEHLTQFKMMNKITRDFHDREIKDDGANGQGQISLTSNYSENNKLKRCSNLFV